MKFENNLQTPTTETHELVSAELDAATLQYLETFPLQGNEKWAEYVDRDRSIQLRIYKPDLVVEGERVFVSKQAHISPQGRETTRINISLTTSPERFSEFQRLPSVELRNWLMSQLKYE